MKISICDLIQTLQKQKGIDNRTVAGWLGITHNNYSRKKNAHTLTAKEIDIIFEKMEVTVDLQSKN